MYISKKEQLSLYAQLLRIRIIEEALCSYYAQQEMRCPVHFCNGQEAVASGVCLALAKEDTVMSNHRSHGHYLAKGGGLKEMVAELYGKKEGCALGRGGSMHLIDTAANFIGATSIVAGTIPVAVGIAFANKLKKNRSVSAVFFGDAATEEGLFYESVNFAALHKLAVLFICENNLYSVYSPLSVRQPESRRIYKVADSLGVKSLRIDGNDVEEVYSAAKKAMKTIRSGGGPFLVEAMTYRWLEHCGPDYDNHIGYRQESEFLKWKKKDPVALYEKQLLKKSVISDSFIKTLKNKINSEVTEAVNYARSLPEPESFYAANAVYAE